MGFDKRVIKVNGVSVDLDVRRDLVISSIDEAQRNVASEMGWWASVWAAAVEEYESAEAYYRQWRARKQEAVLSAEPKLAEYKVKAAIEADDNFYKLKRALAKAKENVVLAENTFKSFDKKANLAQSLGAKKRSELGATGRVTRVESSGARSSGKSPRQAPAAADDGDKERLKKILKGKKGSKGESNSG